MKLITLENIVKYIESKHSKQVVTRTVIQGDKKPNGIIFIHDEGVENLEAFRTQVGILFSDTVDKRVHCILLESDMNDFDKEHPFIKSREALSGILVIDNEIPTEDDLGKYFYKL